jgi:arginine/lysine/ornithine decarboxylase
MQVAPQTATHLAGTAAPSRASREAVLQEAIASTTDTSPSAETIAALDQTAARHASNFVPQPLGISIYE